MDLRNTICMQEGAKESIRKQRGKLKECVRGRKLNTNVERLCLY